jgi:hypothetical protein
MSWFRWWAGTVNDPKWRIIAARANCRPGDCLAVWAYLLEIAKDGDGDISKHDPEECAVVLGYDHLLVETIIVAMRDKELIADGRLTSWEKRQPKREDGSAERAKAWREHKKTENKETERTRTQPNAPETESDTDTDTDTDKKKDKAKALSKKGTRLSPQWGPGDEGWDMALSLLSREEAKAECLKFKDYWRSVPGAKGVKLDWDATWRNWVRSAAERKGHSPPKRQTYSEAANEIIEEMRNERAKSQGPQRDVQLIPGSDGRFETAAEYLPAPVGRSIGRGGD